ncbi:hypothetical protein BJ912DRAFT_278458 [Pholiota molesta]|nr:hypothetical protein BJ912DRAFT_278458 [Pholiota molesta]
MAPLRCASDVMAPQNPRRERLLAIRDFVTTTMSKKETCALTEYLRSVNWIISHLRKDGELILVVMSPYEVNALLENIRKSRSVRLHVYAPRTAQSMKSFDDLAFYCIPPFNPQNTDRPSLSNDLGYQLDIWAGQLYFDNYETYLRLCLLLGISSSESEANTSVESDRFIPRKGRTKEMTAVCLFNKSPLPLLKILFGLRRKGMGFQSTHMGKILQAILLLPKDFEP